MCVCVYVPVRLCFVLLWLVGDIDERVISGESVNRKRRSLTGWTDAVRSLKLPESEEGVMAVKRNKRRRKRRFSSNKQLCLIYSPSLSTENSKFSPVFTACP